MRAVSLLPLLGLGALVAFLFAGLWLDPREVPSPLIDKPAPAFDLAQLHKPELRITDKDLHGTVTLIIVAHRFSTIQQCDVIYLLERGELIAGGSYQNLVSSNHVFQRLALHSTGAGS